jgi:hypothetical protein
MACSSGHADGVALIEPASDGGGDLVIEAEVIARPV